MGQAWEPRRKPSCIKWLQARRERLQEDLARFRRLETQWSWTRLIVFVVGAGVAVSLRWEFLLAGPAAAVGLAVFVASVMRHARWEDRRASAEHALVVVDESLQAGTQRERPARDWRRPENPPDTPALPAAIDAGPTWSLTDQERDDLDLYGPPVGIFGLLNRASTGPGARRLRDVLDRPCLGREHILQRQQAVHWLDIHNEQRLHMMASLVPLRGRSISLDRLVQLLHQRQPPLRSVASRVMRAWSVAAGLLILYALARIGVGEYEWFRLLVGVLLLNGLLLFAFRHMLDRLRTAVRPWADLRSTLGRFLAVAETAGDDLPGETQLSVLKGRFRNVVTQGRIPSLCVWLEWAGLHAGMRGMLNATVFLDLHVAEAALARIVPNQGTFLHGLSAMAELEMLCSLASFSAELAVGCYPRPVTQTGITIKEGRHPLIPEEEVTPNSAELTADKRTWVITGPNAAGKSTFLRMVGVSVLLAQAGAAVPAREMTWSPVRLMTDVRIRDDLARNESYFLSEVRRLRRMVLDSGGDAPVFGLIDEPFRGTNSQERAAAGVALLEYLTASRNLFFVATHEEMLARVAARTPSAENRHFQEHLNDGGITFDYSLRPGPASTKTAIRILEQEGYPGPLLDRARRLMADAR